MTSIISNKCWKIMLSKRWREVYKPFEVHCMWFEVASNVIHKGA